MRSLWYLDQQREARAETACDILACGDIEQAYYIHLGEGRTWPSQKVEREIIKLVVVLDTALWCIL